MQWSTRHWTDQAGGLPRDPAPTPEDCLAGAELGELLEAGVGPS